MRATPLPSVLRSASFGLAYCVPFNNKNNHVWRFHLHKEIKWQYGACTCTSILANVSLVGSLDCLVVDLPLLMYALINVEMTPKKRERTERAKIFILHFLYIIYILYHIYCVSWWTFCVLHTDHVRIAYRLKPTWILRTKKVMSPSLVWTPLICW